MERPRRPTVDDVLSILHTLPNAPTRIIAEMAGVNHNTGRRIIGQVRKETGTSKHHTGVIDVLNGVTHPLTSVKIASASGVNRNTARGIIVRLRRQGRITKTDNNRYKLTD